MISNFFHVQIKTKNGYRDNVSPNRVDKRNTIGKQNFTRKQNFTLKNKSNKKL